MEGWSTFLLRERSAFAGNWCMQWNAYDVSEVVIFVSVHQADPHREIRFAHDAVCFRASKWLQCDWFLPSGI